MINIKETSMAFSPEEQKFFDKEGYFQTSEEHYQKIYVGESMFGKFSIKISFYNLTSVIFYILLESMSDSDIEHWHECDLYLQLNKILKGIKAFKVLSVGQLSLQSYAKIGSDSAMVVGQLSSRDLRTFKATTTILQRILQTTINTIKKYDRTFDARIYAGVHRPVKDQKLQRALKR